MNDDCCKSINSDNKKHAEKKQKYELVAKQRIHLSNLFILLFKGKMRSQRKSSSSSKKEKK